MKKTTLAAALVFASLAASGCANTIRGAGQDAANTVNATQSAVENTERAVVN